MQEAEIGFYGRAAAALGDGGLRESLSLVRDKFTSHRATAVLQYEEAGGDFEALRERGMQIRTESVRRMPELLLEFERNAQAAGAEVLWAKDAAAAREIIVALARKHDVNTVVKSKSMASEEIFLNRALQDAGIEAVESDLGEFIIQLANETPSHIIAPAMHKRKEEVAELLRSTVPVDGDDIPSLTRAARMHLRRKFLRAQMGISGANFLIADAGASVIVTNEGNGRMTTTLPKVHVALAGIDKIIARWQDLPDMLCLLTRSATGQRLTNYVSISAGVRDSADADHDGPAHMYIVLLDNGRSALRNSDCSEMLRCIRCGACMNHCPVYHAIGGHAYGSTYMGPMGQVLTPHLNGLQSEPDLPHAATMCSACEVVCPVKIPLPALMRRLRARQMRALLRPRKERWVLRLWFFFASRPKLYAFAAACAGKLFNLLGGRQKQIRNLPFVRGWFATRNLAVSSGVTFRGMRTTMKR